MAKDRSPRYVGPKVETRLPEDVIDWYDNNAAIDNMTRAEYIREVLLEHKEKNS